MLWGGHSGGLELRKRASGGLALRGRFPYGNRAVLSDGGRTGRPRKEVIAPRAFAYRVDNPDEDIHFLVGHSYDRPLASRKAGTLDLQDSDEALTFEARITPEMQEVSYVRDFLTSFNAGLIVGLSPGFRIPPKRAVQEAERIEDEGSDPENGEHNAIIRTVLQALLYEMSVVTRPAYDGTQIEARNWSAETFDPSAGLVRTLSRWRV
ncbi:HK97 family phage prohead protease [Henriciella litoralis]|uniref:HK97 family phage prohead protease n=1 Tax=Henriciella litoralis TaxID=568102 RepID=UPI000A077DB6|nr:HK97 family phage prohead protease [Henriciella litoralis]